MGGRRRGRGYEPGRHLPESVFGRQRARRLEGTKERRRNNESQSRRVGLVVFLPDCFQTPHSHKTRPELTINDDVDLMFLILRSTSQNSMSVDGEFVLVPIKATVSETRRVRSFFLERGWILTSSVSS